MTERLRNVLVEIDTNRVLEAHSSYEITDEELLSIAESGEIDVQLVEDYLDIYERMVEGTLTEEDQLGIFEAYSEGLMDPEAYQTLLEDGLVDIDLTKEFLLESFLDEANATAVYKAPTKDQVKSMKFTTTAPNTNQAAQTKAQPQKRTFGEKVLSAGRRTAAGIARGVGYVAGKVGAHNIAKTAYAFAGNRYKNDGDSSRAKVAYQNAKNQRELSKQKMDARTAAKNKVEAATNNNNNQNKSAATAPKPTSTNNTAVADSYSPLNTLNIRHLI